MFTSKEIITIRCAQCNINLKIDKRRSRADFFCAKCSREVHIQDFLKRQPPSHRGSRVKDAKPEMSREEVREFMIEYDNMERKLAKANAMRTRKLV